MKCPTAFLASPYSNPSFWERKARAEAASLAALWLLHTQNVVPYAPIPQYHTGVALSGTSGSFEAFRRNSEHFLMKSDMLIILRLYGWQSSKGVDYEYRQFVKLSGSVSIVSHVGIIDGRPRLVHNDSKSRQELHDINPHEANSLFSPHI